MTKEATGKNEYEAEGSYVVIVPYWWRWDPKYYDKDQYPAEPPKDDPIWQQPEWDKPVYDHQDGWAAEPPQDNPEQPPMHYKPWEPKPEHEPHDKDGHKEHEPHDDHGHKEHKGHDDHGHKEHEPHGKHDHKDDSHHHHHHHHHHEHGDDGSHVYSVPPGYPEALDPYNINITINISFAVSHHHGGNHQQYHEFIDDLFDWGEATYKEVMPSHEESYLIENYFARMYDNGQAVGEKDGNIYHYDGYEIHLVGTTEEIAGWAHMDMNMYMG